MKVHIGYQPLAKRFKFAEDVDSLAPDINHYWVREVGLDELRECVRALETAGYQEVCVDFKEYFYRTGQE